MFALEAARPFSPEDPRAVSSKAPSVITFLVHAWGSSLGAATAGATRWCNSLKTFPAHTVIRVLVARLSNA